MRILYVSQYYPPEMGAPAARVSELSRHWVHHGDEVTLLTAFAHHPTGMKAPEDRGRLTRRENDQGVDLVRCYVYAAPNKGIVKRMLSYLSFMLSASVFGTIRVRRPDVVVATSPQLLCGCAGYLLARLKRCPFVFEVRDLWPESVLAVGAMGDNLVVKGLRRIARLLYERSDLIVTVGEGYRQEIHQRYDIPLEKMEIVPNGIDPDLFAPSSRDNWVRRRYGWRDRFVVMYIGTHGMAHGLETVLRAASELQSEPQILFVFVGEGAEKDRLMELASTLNLPNVQFLGQQPREQISNFYAACDLGLVTLRDSPLFQGVLPSKIFELMAMERPVLTTVGGEAKRLVERSGGGVYVPPEDPAKMADTVRKLASASQELERMGTAGRVHVRAEFDRSVQALRYRQLLETVILDHRQDKESGPRAISDESAQPSRRQDDRR